MYRYGIRRCHLGIGNPAGIQHDLKRPLNKGQGHAHFRGKLLVRLLGISHTKPRTKFEISSSSSFPILCSKRNWGHKFDLSRSHDHSIATTISYWWSFGTKSLSITVSEIFNVKCNTMVDVTLIRPLNKGQGHSFWYQSISHTTTSYRLSIVTFCSRTHHLATIQYITSQTTTTHATLA